MKERYHKCFATDNNYVHIMATSIISILENNIRNKDKIVFWILDDGLTDDIRSRLEKNVRGEYGADIRFIDVREQLSEIICLKARQWNNGSYSAYSRIFLGVCIPEEIEKILYLDSDTLILGDLEDFFDIQQKSYARCSDWVIKTFIIHRNILRMNVKAPLSSMLLKSFFIDHGLLIQIIHIKSNGFIILI